MVKNISFKALIRRAAECKPAGQQIIFGTSQPTSEIEDMLRGLDYPMLDFGDSRIIKRIPESPKL